MTRQSRCSQENQHKWSKSYSLSNCCEGIPPHIVLIGNVFNVLHCMCKWYSKTCKRLTVIKITIITFKSYCPHFSRKWAEPCRGKVGGKQQSILMPYFLKAQKPNSNIHQKFTQTTEKQFYKLLQRGFLKPQAKICRSYANSSQTYQILHVTHKPLSTNWGVRYNSVQSTPTITLL